MPGRGDGAAEDAVAAGPGVTGLGGAAGGGAAGAAGGTAGGAFDGNGSLGAGGLTREQLAAAVAAAAAGGGGGGGLMHQAPIPEHRVRKFHKLLQEPVVRGGGGAGIVYTQTKRGGKFTPIPKKPRPRTSPQSAGGKMPKPTATGTIGTPNPK